LQMFRSITSASKFPCPSQHRKLPARDRLSAASLRAALTRRLEHRGVRAG
jgi:hypothetical protein